MQPITPSRHSTALLWTTTQNSKYLTKLKIVGFSSDGTVTIQVVSKWCIARWSRYAQGVNTLQVLAFIYVLKCFNFLLDEENSLHVVVNCGEALLKNNTYWPLVSDFINILSHQSVAKKFLEDHKLLVTWMNFVSFFQGMWSCYLTTVYEQALCR